MKFLRAAEPRAPYSRFTYSADSKMTPLDWIVLVGYLAGTLAVGLLLGKLVKSTRDLFSAGRNSPWWMSGLSAFMTMFSANTFVVWGGIAYTHGLVAVVINLCYGIAAILVGFTVAGRWSRLDIRSPAEYIERRYGRKALHFYTWFMMAYRLVGTGGALYAIALISITVMSEENGASLATPLFLNTAIITFAVVIVAYTMVGGLWAVLVTDTLQFIILNLAVLFVIPLLLLDMGGLGEISTRIPEGFLSLTSSRYTWFFLAGWVAIHYFMIGAEWAFVQRFLCVRSPSEARKGTFLFGGLYLFSPFLWLLPPLLWRLKVPLPPDADPVIALQMAETAYILSCKSVLPAGMLGLMLAGLFSATASMISSQLNVFSNVLTNDIYRAFDRRGGDERHMLKAGRLFTVLLGVLIAVIALLTPAFGGAAKVIIGVTEVMVVPLLAPSLAGLIFRRLDARAIWITVCVCFPLSVIGRFTHLFEGLWLAQSTFTGVVLPIIITGVLLIINRKSSPSAPLPLLPVSSVPHPDGIQSAHILPIQIIGWSLLTSGFTLIVLVPFNVLHQMALLVGGIPVVTIGVLILRMASTAKSKFAILRS